LWRLAREDPRPAEDASTDLEETGP
jgi:hypothetical protein